jgi:hypothetical protein
MSCDVVMADRLGTPFWAHFWDTLLSFASSVKKREGKRRQATVFQTAAFDQVCSPRLRRKELGSKAGDSLRQ